MKIITAVNNLRIEYGNRKFIQALVILFFLWPVFAAEVVYRFALIKIASWRNKGG